MQLQVCGRRRRSGSLLSARRVGILGGTFNPPHLAHVICAQEARLRLDLDEVLLVPAGEATHKAVAGDPGAEMRAILCELAVEGQPGLAVSRVELERPGPSYTVDTLDELETRSPADLRFLIIGSDQALTFGTWRDPGRVCRLATIAVAERGNADHEEIRAALTAAAPHCDPLFVGMPRVDIASSDVRERIAAGDPVSHLLPLAVAGAIEREGLYR